MYIVVIIEARSSMLTVHVPDATPVVKSGVIAMPMESVITSKGGIGPQMVDQLKRMVVPGTGMPMLSIARSGRPGATAPARTTGCIIPSRSWICVGIVCAAPGSAARLVSARTAAAMRTAAPSRTRYGMNTAREASFPARRKGDEAPAQPVISKRLPRKRERAATPVDRVIDRSRVAREMEAEAAGADRLQARRIVGDAEPSGARRAVDAALVGVGRGPRAARHHEPCGSAVRVVREPR